MLGKGTLLRLRGGTTVKSAAKIAGSRRRLAVKHKRAAANVAKPLDAGRAANFAARPASNPKSSSPLDLPEHSDANAESDAEVEEAAKRVEGKDVVALLEAQLGEAVVARKAAEADSEREKARTTRVRAAKKLLKQKLAVELDKADKVEPPLPADDADATERLAYQLAKLVGKRPASASSKSDPRRPKPFTGEGDQDSAGSIRRFTSALALFFELSNTKPNLWAANAS